MHTDIDNAEKINKKIWEKPWGFKESILINLALLIAGFVLEFVLSEYRITLPGWPINLVIAIGLIVIFWISSKILNNRITSFLSGVPAAVTAISFVMFLVLLMAFIPQQRQEGWIQTWGLTHLKNSWPYLFSAIYLLAILGHAIFKRLNKFNLKNIGFFLNHAGLWILIASASLGSADIKMFNMNLVLDRAIYFAEDKNGITQQLPFAIKLLEFDIEEYPPSLAIIDNETSKIVTKKGEKLFDVNIGNKFNWNDWQFEIEQSIAEARYKDGQYDSSSTMGATPAVEIKAVNVNSGVEKTGWISAGNFMYDKQLMPLNETLSLAMTVQAPKKFSSKLRIFKTVSKYEDAEIIVNKPIEVFGYKIYQVGYDEKMGKWSKMSAIQLIRDPWLPAVYTSIFMILAGSLYLALTGRSKTIKD
ncbi:MAG: cytochrome c biogenesis protein ResB [Bacteroidetes bacterium]|nr:cytochrome c biogenesis protein ResB [Bacteroidota bacterium]